MSQIELFSARVCPFAHRVRLAIMEKGLPCELVEIDLRDKPSWYLDIYPAGAVPTLRHDDFFLSESLIINEYIDELRHDPPLMPQKAMARAEARLWMDFAGTQFVSQFYRLLKAQDDDNRSKSSQDLHSALKTIDTELAKRRSNGPYWFGEKVSLTDIAFYPWFERWPVLEHYRGLSIPEQFSTLRDWIATMQQRDSVRMGRAPESFYIEAYADYASGRK